MFSRFSSFSLIHSRPFSHQHRRCRELIEDYVLLVVVSAKGQDAGRTLLDTRGTADTLRVFHRQHFVGEIHDIDSLMTDRSADVARNALVFIGEYSVTRKTRVNVHECGKRAGEAAPNPTAEPKVEPNAENAGHEDIDAPGVVQERDALKKLVIPMCRP